MSEHDLDWLDDVVFEPNGWDMAVDMRIRVDPETDREALDELADAMLVWADEPVLERLTDEALDRIWDDRLQQLIRDGLMRLSVREEWHAGVAAALAEFDRNPRGAEVSREVVRHLAMQLGQADTPFLFCLDCLDHAISEAPADERRALALRAAIVAARNAAGLDGSPAQRRAVRARLGRLGELGRDSLSALAAELCAIAAEPLSPRAEEDDVWAVVYAQLLAEAVRPELN
ncbi:MAG TPA: hypothetical protein VMU73_06735 [Gaiellaceae bacterium]|nr:hypothetical protein [Gaiellaceae bacterium]